MLVNVVGRVNNVHLSRSTPLLPLFEAIVNSLDAVEEAPNAAEGKVTIRVERDMSQKRLLDDDDSVSYPIAGFVVEDNGIGFDAQNFNAFKTSDTPFKQYKGGERHR